jgi:LmbE family N-acetylglucosaminyl deacetylase
MMERRSKALSWLIAAVFLFSGMAVWDQTNRVSAENLLTDVAAQAADLTAGCVFGTPDDIPELENLIDSRVSTVWTSQGASSIDITSDQDIGSLYIEWKDIPASWTLSVWFADRFVFYKTGGEFGFLNEFVPIDAVCKKVRISWDQPAPPVSIGEIRVYSKGTVPADVQQWKPPCEKADLLVIPTHMDDEHLYFGGTLSTYAAEKKKDVQVAYLINCGTVRIREALSGLWTVGITNYPLISDFPDQYADTIEDAAAIYGHQNILEYQVMLLRRFKPDVVVGHDLDGEYGHGAHKLNAKTLTEAIPAAEDPAQFPQTAEEFGAWGIMKCYLHLYDQNGIVMDWTVPLEAFDGKSSWEMAKLGYDKHVSQHVFKFRVRIEGPNDCRLFGLYYTTVGADVDKNDFFENIPVKTVSPTPDESSDPFSSSFETSGADSSDTSQPASPSSDPSIGKTDGRVWIITGVIALLVAFVFMCLLIGLLRNDRKKKKKRRSR